MLFYVIWGLYEILLYFVDGVEFCVIECFHGCGELLEDECLFGDGTLFDDRIHFEGIVDYVFILEWDVDEDCGEIDGEDED